MFSYANKPSTNNSAESMRQMPLHYNNTTILVNIAQYDYIQRRRMRRKFLDGLMAENNNKNYTHESRHKHAMTRLRAPSGRFLTKWEAVEYRNNMKREE